MSKSASRLQTPNSQSWIRKRSAVFFGSDSEMQGFIAFKCLADNAVEHAAAYGQKILFILHLDGRYTVQDSGRGLPFTARPRSLPTLRNYLAATCCTFLEATTARQRVYFLSGKKRFHTFCRGKGTRLTFKLDPEVFTKTTVPRELIFAYAQQVVLNHPQMEITIVIETPSGFIRAKPYHAKLLQINPDVSATKNCFPG